MLLGFAPLYFCREAGRKGATTGMVSSIAFVLVSITSTVSDWSSTTYRSVWAAFSVILLGWTFTGSLAVTDGSESAKDVDPGDHPPRFTTSISRSRMLDTYAAASKPLPFTTTQNGSSPPGTPFSVILLGWPFTGSRAVTDGVQSAKDVDPGDHPPRFTTSISRSRMLDTYAVASKPLPFTTTQNGSSPPGTPACQALLLPGRRSSSIPFDQWPRPPVKTVIESL